MNTHTRPSFWSTVSIVAQREIRVRFLSKAFLVSTGVLLGLNLLFVVFMPMLGDSLRGGPPVAMPVQMYLGKVGWVEVSLSLAVLLTTTIVAILVASRVYDRGLLQMGKPMKWREALAKAE